MSPEWWTVPAAGTTFTVSAFPKFNIVSFGTLGSADRIVLSVGGIKPDEADAFADALHAAAAAARNGSVPLTPPPSGTDTATTVPPPHPPGPGGTVVIPSLAELRRDIVNEEEG